MDSTKKFGFAVNVSGTWKTLLSTTTYNLGVWNYVTGTYDGTTLRIYVNGVADGTLAASGSVSYQNAADTVYIGQANTVNFNGAIDEPRIYNTTLTAGQITNLFGSAAKPQYGYVTTNSVGNEYVRPFANPEPVTTVDTEQDPSQVDPTLYVNNTFNSVGINTANPISLLTLSGNNNTSNSFMTINAAQTKFDSTAFIYGINSAPTINSTTTGTPLAGLGGLQSAPLFQGNGTLGNLYGLTAIPSNNSSGTVTSEFGMYSRPDISAGTTTNEYNYYAAAPTGNGTITNKYAFVSEANAGNVGIGTTAPAAKLEIQINSTTDPSAGGLNGVKLVNQDTTANSLEGIQFYSYDDGSTSRHGGAIVAGKTSNWVGGSGNYPGFLAFWTRPSGTIESERMRITDTGNVGIGTTSPLAALHIVGSASESANLTFYGASTAHTINYDDLGTINFVRSPAGEGGSAATSTLFLGSSGNVGIGTTSPSAPLAVVGTAGTSFTTQADFGGQKWRMQQNGGDETNAGVIDYRGFDASGLSIVGAGTSGTNRLVHIFDNLEVDRTITVDNSAANTGGTSSWLQFGGTSSGEGILSKRNSGGNVNGLDLLTSSSSRITITNGGLVGIGKSPGFNLDVNGSIAQSLSINCNITANGSGELTCISDERLKNIYGFYQGGIQQLQNINPIRFSYKNESYVHVGFSAQNVGSVLPEGAPLQNSGFFGLDSNAVLALAVNSIKDIAASQSGTQLQIQQLQNFELTQTGDIFINDATPSADFTIPHYYTLSDTLGNPITRMGAFLELAVGNLRAGSVQAQQIFTNSLAVSTANITVAGQSLSNYIISVVNNAISNGTIHQSGNGIVSPVATLQTGVISPLGDNPQIAIRLNNSGIEIAKNASTSAVASIDNNGNATFSGQLNSQNLAVNSDATVSGTLHAHKIVADSIEGLQAAVGTLSAQNITNVTNIYFATPSGTPGGENISMGPGPSSSSSAGVPTPPSSGQAFGSSFANIASLSGYFAYVPNLSADTATFNQGLMSLGATSLADTTITGQLSIGTNLILANSSINVLGADLQIQPLRQGGIAFVGGQVHIDTDGNLSVNGNATVKGNLAVGTLSPLAGSDLNVNLPSDQNHNSSFIIHNSTNSAVFSLNQVGDLIASGEATISKLNFNVVTPALAISDTEVVATGSAGTAAVKGHQTEITIDNPNVTNKSLIYITPVGNTNNQTPYLLRQVSSKSFTVGIPLPQIFDSAFNWLLVN